MDPSGTIRQAIALAQSGDKTQARRLVGELLKIDPGNADAWVVMAQIVDSQNEAVACMKKALELRPDDEHARHYLDYLQQQKTTRRGRISPLMIAGGLAILALLCILGLLLSGRLPLGQRASAATSTAAIDCRTLIDQALTISNDNCQRLDMGQVCYGHTTVRASLQSGAKGRFQQMGDVLSFDSLTRLSAAPLNLNTQEWGVGIFKLQANLPYTVPGQNVTMVIAGNTSLQNTSGTMQAFSFTSGVGGINCESIPLNGLIVRMPNGAGIRLQVNGSDLALSGNAYMQAQTDGKMQVSLFDGGGWISSQGVSQYFKAGETASVPLTGTTSSGPPSVATGSAGELCALFGTCGSATSTPSSDQAVAMLQTIVPLLPTNTPAPVASSRPTNTPVPVDPRLPTNTPVPVAPGMPTNTSVPLPTNTPAPLPTTTQAQATATATPRTASTSSTSATNTPRPAATNTPRPTITPEPPTRTPAPPTDTAVPADTAVPTATEAPSCDRIALAWGGTNPTKLTMTIIVANNNATPIQITQTDVSWPSAGVKLAALTLGSQFWSGPPNKSSPASISATSLKKIGASGGTGSLVFTFDSTPDSSGYTVKLTFDLGCAAAPFSN